MQPKPAPARLSGACCFVECPASLSFSDCFFRFHQKKSWDYSFNRRGNRKDGIFYSVLQLNGLRLERLQAILITFLK